MHAIRIVCESDHAFQNCACNCKHHDMVMEHIEFELSIYTSDSRLHAAGISNDNGPASGRVHHLIPLPRMPRTMRSLAFASNRRIRSCF